MRNPSEIDQAVSRTLRDSLEKLQRTAEELNQAVNDLVSACASSRPSNSLPPMLRAQTAAASLSGSLEVLSRFVIAAVQPPPGMTAEQQSVIAAAAATAAAQVEAPEAAAYGVHPAALPEIHETQPVSPEVHEERLQEERLRGDRAHEGEAREGRALEEDVREQEAHQQVEQNWSAPAPAMSEPAVESEAAQSQSIETQPVETQPAETQPAETQPAETQPAEAQPVETQQELRSSDMVEEGAPVLPTFYDSEPPPHMTELGVALPETEPARQEPQIVLPDTEAPSYSSHQETFADLHASNPVESAPPFDASAIPYFSEAVTDSEAHASEAQLSPAPAPPFDLSALRQEERDLHRRADRVAKVAMQDIKMLHPEDVKLGKENHDLCMRLRDDIERARREYDRRFHSILDHPVDYFYNRMVEILGDGKPETLGDYPYPTPVLRR